MRLSVQLSPNLFSCFVSRSKVASCTLQLSHSHQMMEARQWWVRLINTHKRSYAVKNNHIHPCPVWLTISHQRQTAKLSSNHEWPKHRLATTAQQQNNNNQTKPKAWIHCVITLAETRRDLVQTFRAPSCSGGLWSSSAPLVNHGVLSHLDAVSWAVQETRDRSRRGGHSVRPTSLHGSFKPRRPTGAVKQPMVFEDFFWMYLLNVVCYLSLSVSCSFNFSIGVFFCNRRSSSYFLFSFLWWFCTQSSTCVLGQVRVTTVGACFYFVLSINK